MLKGLPASGKSTYAKELVAKGWKRVNKDDLRAMMDDSKWSRANEKIIISSEMDLVVNLLVSGSDVIVDSTNFAHENKWKNVAEERGATFEVKFFDVPLMECIERDSRRGDKSVGSKVIYKMYEEYLEPKKSQWDVNLPYAYIFDIDGTLAKSEGRSPYDYSKVSTDSQNEDVALIFRLLAGTSFVSNKLIVVSGRDSFCKQDTLNWLDKWELTPDLLYMRARGDSRKDSIVKKEIYDNEIKGKYNVLGVFDDRNQVVEMWRSLGLTCFQVAYGYF